MVNKRSRRFAVSISTLVCSSISWVRYVKYVGGILESSVKRCNDTTPPLWSFLKKYVLRPTTLAELRSVVHSLNVHSALGPDGLPVSLFKFCLGRLAYPIMHVFNSSITRGVVPQCWKTAEVVPIYKGKGDPNSASSFRPISLLNVASKILEKLVALQLSRIFGRLLCFIRWAVWVSTEPFCWSCSHFADGIHTVFHWQWRHMSFGVAGFNPRTPGGFGRTPTPGGGVDFRPPPLRSRKLRRLEKNGKRRLVDWEKHYKKHSDNFSLKSKLRSPEVIKGKIFPNFRITWHGFILCALSRSL